VYSLAVVLLFVSRSKHKAEDPPQKKKPVKESMIQLKPVRVIEDGREGEPEDRAFTVEMDDKHNTEEKEPLKSKVLGSGEGTPAAEVGEPAETTAARCRAPEHRSDCVVLHCCRHRFLLQQLL